MRNIFLLLMIVCSPAMLSAQQKSSSQEQLRKEMEEMKSEMQAKVKALQDSVALLREQLAERNAGSSWFKLYSPYSDEQRSELEDLLRKKEWSYNYQLPQVPLMPEAPAEPYKYRLEIPSVPEIHVQPYDYYFSVPDEKKLKKAYKYHYDVSPCPDEKRHNHDWMKGLPFYDWFNK